MPRAWSLQSIRGDTNHRPTSGRWWRFSIVLYDCTDQSIIFTARLKHSPLVSRPHFQSLGVVTVDFLQAFDSLWRISSGVQLDSAWSYRRRRTLTPVCIGDGSVWFIFLEENSLKYNSFSLQLNKCRFTFVHLKQLLSFLFQKMKVILVLATILHIGK